MASSDIVPVLQFELQPSVNRRDCTGTFPVGFCAPRDVTGYGEPLGDIVLPNEGDRQVAYRTLAVRSPLDVSTSGGA